MARSKSLIYAVYKYRAKKKKLGFKINQKDFFALIIKNCSYCGVAPPTGGFHGVDRVDNNKGYILNNCVTACGVCNRWKSSMELKQFVLLAKDIYETSLKKKSKD